MATKQEINPKITGKKINNFYQAKVLEKPLKEISKDNGETVRQISYDIADIQYYIQGSANFQNAGDKIIDMIPKSLDVYDKHLNANDLLAARDVMKWIGIHIERTKHSGNINLNNMSNDDLASFVIEAISAGREEAKEEIEEPEQDGGV